MGRDSALLLLRCPGREFKSKPLFLGGGLEMAGYLTDTGKETALALFGSPKTEPFQSVAILWI